MGIAPATERSYRLAISQLSKHFDRQLLCDTSGENVSAFQGPRKRDGASNRTINLEMGVLRAILRRYRMWGAIAQDIDFLKEARRQGEHSAARRRHDYSTLLQRVDPEVCTP